MESTALEPDLARMPPLLRTGEKVRFVSPASTPERDAVFQSASILENWGAPTLILIGESDDWTPAERCREMVAHARRDSGGVQNHTPVF